MKKGIGLFAIQMLILAVIVVSIYLFFIFFKLHVITFLTDEININKYQEFPLSFYLTVFEDKDAPDTPIVFAVNKVHVSSTDYPETKITQSTFAENKVKSVLPPSCFQIIIDTKNKIEIKDIEGLKAEKKRYENVQKLLPTFLCDVEQKKFTIKYPFPVFENGKPKLVNFETTIFGAKDIGGEVISTLTRSFWVPTTVTPIVFEKGESV